MGERILPLSLILLIPVDGGVGGNIHSYVTVVIIICSVTAAAVVGGSESDVGPRCCAVVVPNMCGGWDCGPAIHPAVGFWSSQSDGVIHTSVILRSTAM